MLEILKRGRKIWIRVVEGGCKRLVHVEVLAKEGSRVRSLKI